MDRRFVAVSVALVAGAGAVWAAVDQFSLGVDEEAPRMRLNPLDTPSFPELTEKVEKYLFELDEDKRKLRGRALLNGTFTDAFLRRMDQVEETRAKIKEELESLKIVLGEAKNRSSVEAMIAAADRRIFNLTQEANGYLVEATRLANKG